MKTPRTGLAVSLALFTAACGAYEEEVDELAAATTCGVKLKVYPVRARHNNGYDKTAGNSSLWSCDDAYSNTDYYSGHLGNDIWAAEGAPVAATVDGRLTLVGYSSYSGNKVTIVDDCGWYHFYCHLKSIAPGMKDGVRVKAGTIIGSVGKTGTASNGVVHLHYSIYPDGNYNRGIDPWPALKAVEKNVCGNATPTPTPPAAPPAYLSSMRRRASGDNGTVCGRASSGILCQVYDGKGLTTTVDGPDWTNANGWDADKYNSTIQLGDLDGDGRADLCARAADGIHCHLGDGKSFGPKIAGPKWADSNGWGSPEYYTTIQLADVNGDGKADLCARASDKIYCYLSDGKGFPTEVQGPAWSNGNGWDDPKYYTTIQFPDINGDGKADVCARAADGIQCHLSNGTSFPTHIKGPAWSDAANWDEPQYNATIRFVDVNGDGKDDVCGRAAAGIICHLSDGKGFPTRVNGPAWADAQGWADPQYYATIQFADVNGDGKADVCGRASTGVLCQLSDGAGFPTRVTGPAWTNSAGWSKPEYWATIQLADIDGDGKADVCARASDSVRCHLSDGQSFPIQIPGPAWSDANAWNQPKYYTTLRYVAAAPKPAAPGAITSPPGSEPATEGTPTPDGDAAPAASGCAVARTTAPMPPPALLAALGLAVIAWRRRCKVRA